jgi:glycosyltransferase involved in cell wall biosynthesis
MKIGFDISQTGKVKAGCGYFADGLIRQLAASDPSNEYILYPAVGDLFWDPECATATFDCDRPNFRRMRAPKDFSTSQHFWRHPPKDFEHKLGNPDLVHANNFYCPRGLNQARLVYTLYDLHFLEEPAWTTEQNRIGCFDGVFHASLRADLIIAISEYTKRHFLSIFPHFPEERMAVIYPASRFDESPKTCPERLDNLQPGHFWLSVGTIEPRKNHGALLDAYRILKRECDSIPPLVLAGARGWLLDDLNERLHGLEPGRDVILPGYVPDAQLQWLFRNCFAFIFPSLFEGFGMPVLEALGLGAPVLCSNTSSLPEVGGDAAIYFDPRDPRSIANAMIRIVEGEVNRDFLRSAAQKQAKGFSWEISAARLCEMYAEVLSFPPTRSPMSNGQCPGDPRLEGAVDR